MWSLKTGGPGDRYNNIEMQDLLPGITDLSRQVVSNGSGLSRQVSLYSRNYIYDVNERLLVTIIKAADGYSYSSIQ